MKKLAMIMVVVCLGLAVSAQATPAMPVWHSYDATIRTASGGLIRGDIVDANTSINAQLKFYMSSDVLGVAEAASVTTGGNGLYSTTAPDACKVSGGDSLELIMDFSNYWRLPGGTGPFAIDLTQAAWFVPFAGKQLTVRPNDGSQGDLPGGIGTAGERDLSFHPPSTWSEGDVNVFPDEFKFENHLGVIAFIAPQDGEYEISNFGARAMELIGAVDRDRPNDLADQSVHIIDDRTGSPVVLDSIIAGGLIGSDRDITWKLSGNTTTVTLSAGEEIHFAVHSTAPFAPIAADQEFYYDATNVAFDITLVPEPATIGLLAMGGIAILVRKKRRGA